MVVALGWLVLALVFVDEVLALGALGVWGASQPGGWLLVWLLPLAGILVWNFFASPKAAYGGPVVRPVAKVVVFGLACLALWDAGHPGWALALLVFSVLVNALAQLPQARALVPPQPPRRPNRAR